MRSSGEDKSNAWQARLRVGKRLKQLQSARKQLLARLHGLANPTPEVYDEAIEASAALQGNMQARSKVCIETQGHANTATANATPSAGRMVLCPSNTAH